MINLIASVSANTVAPFVPLGRQPVGLESSDLKGSSLPALEQSADSARGENRNDPSYKPNQNAERDRIADGAIQARQQPQQAEQDNSVNKKNQDAPDQDTKDQGAIKELASTDRDVRAHEQAHAAVGGQFAGSPTYSFKRGPDGVAYAVGGEVAIDTSPVPGDPEATIRKAQIIRAAANAPAEPSSQDRRVAAQAASLENEARAQLAAQNSSDIQKSDQATQDKSNARKLEAKVQAEKEDDLHKEIQGEDEKQRTALLRSNQERDAILSRSAQTTFDIGRRLVEMGVVKGTPSLGSLFNGVV